MSLHRSRAFLKRERNTASTLASSFFGYPYVGGAAAFLLASAFVNHQLAKKAERDNPPGGRFY